MINDEIKEMLRGARGVQTTRKFLGDLLRALADNKKTRPLICEAITIMFPQYYFEDQQRNK